MNSLILEELEEARARGLSRKLRTLAPAAGAKALWEGREIILFCGNDYLGLSKDPRVMRAAEDAIRTYGVGAGAARLISGTSDLHARLEIELARFKDSERALIFGSGYLANLGILSALAGEKDLIVMDKLCHASLIDGARLSGAVLRTFPHKNYAKAGEILQKGTAFQKCLLVSDTVFSMDGDLADLVELERLREKYGALLIVDDAHGIGVFGREGRGAADGDRLKKIDAVVGTLSKSLGVLGGFVAASAVLIEHLIHFSRPFLFATAPPPLLMAAALESLRLLQAESSPREKLWENFNRVRDFLISRKIRTENEAPIFPILVGDESKAVRISEALLEKGVLIPAIRYPTVPRGKARLRLTMSAIHTKEDLEKLFQAFEDVLPLFGGYPDPLKETL